MTEEQFFVFMDHLGLFDTVTYNDMGAVELVLNDAQEVAVAAALAAWAEANPQAADGG